MGVLIYLAGLAGINQDVYDVAKMDGVGPIGLFIFVELPLILFTMQHFVRGISAGAIKG